jgi:hypothetical protein
MADRLPWLVLAYRVPAEPTRLRSAVWRRLKAVGAVYLAHSVAAMPASPVAERLLGQLRSDIGGMGGSAQLLHAEALAGETDMIRLFNAARDDEYVRIIAECDELRAGIESLVSAGQPAAADLDQGRRKLDRLARWNEMVREADAFGASQAKPAAAALVACRDALGWPAPPARAASPGGPK